MEQRPKRYKPVQFADLLHSHANLQIIKGGKSVRTSAIPFSVSLPDNRTFYFEINGLSVVPINSEGKILPFDSLSEEEYQSIPECDRYLYRLV